MMKRRFGLWHYEIRKIAMSSICIAKPALLPDIRKAAPESGTEIGAVGRNLDRLPGRFTPQPALQFFRRSMNTPTVTGDWQAARRSATEIG
jgi:hypothetical protein